MIEINIFFVLALIFTFTTIHLYIHDITIYLMLMRDRKVNLWLQYIGGILSIALWIGYLW